MQKSFRYIPHPKTTAVSNPIILNERTAFWAFWSAVAVVAVLIVVATSWLLTHPVA